MNGERKLTLTYFILGITMGLLSTRLDAVLSFGIGAVLYIVSFFLVKKIVSENKKFLWYVMNTLVTFALVWLVTWVFLFNL